MIRFVSGYCMHPVASVETYRRIVPPRVLFWAHLLVPDLEVGSSSVQFSCSAVVMILCTASSGGSVVFKQRVMAVVVVRWCMGVPGDSRGRKWGSGLLWVFAISYKPIAVQECMGRMSFPGVLDLHFRYRLGAAVCPGVSDGWTLVPCRGPMSPLWGVARATPPAAADVAVGPVMGGRLISSSCVFYWLKVMGFPVAGSTTP